MTSIKRYDPFQAPLKTFTALTFELIKQKEYDTLKICFNFIERFLVNGDLTVKIALSGSFIPSLFAYLQECEWKQEVVNLMPRKLRTMYCGHASKSTIRNDYVHFIVHLN